MNGNVLFSIIQIIACVLITLLVLIQSKGTGLFSSLAGSIGFYRSRRGIEKFIFITTIIMSVVLVVNSLLITLS